jgi:DNA-binding response OmpR family regulator/chromosome segregation ATPase
VFSALIIDADPEAARSIQATLRPHGFEFTATQDANEAMSLARTATPDIIFLRVELPNVSGFSVCNKLRRNDETKYIPLVMYASGVSDDVFNQHRNLKTHADEYIKLPFADGQLIQILRGLIDLPEGVPTGGGEPDEGSLDVDIDDVDEEAKGRPARDALEMREFDAMSQETGPHSPVPAPQDVGLGAETDAAFDALTLDAEAEDEVEVAPVAAAPEPLAEPDTSATSESGASLSIDTDPEPEPEPEPEPAPEPEPEPAPQVEAQPEPAPEPAPPRRASRVVAAPIDGTDTTGDEDAATTGPGEFRAQREVISLKAQLNAKNREILGLKEELESRDRAALDLKHKNRELLTQIGDIEEKLVGAEEEIITSRERAEAAIRDKNTVLKREEGLKARLEHAQKKIKDGEEQLAAAQATAASAEQKHQSDVAALQASLEASQREHAEQRARAEGLEREFGATTMRLTEANAALEQARARGADLADAVTKLEEEAAGLRREIERVRREGEEDRATALAEARELADADKAAALKALGEEQQAELEFAEGQRRAEVDKVRAEGEEAVAAARADVENLRAQITEAEEAATAERERMQRQIADLRAEAASTAEKLTQERDATKAALDRESATLRDTATDLEQTRATLRVAESDLAARREAARRAEQALAVAMRVLDERAAQ